MFFYKIKEENVFLVFNIEFYNLNFKFRLREK